METPYLWRLTFDQSIVPYSLGDAIDWKLDVDVVSVFFNHVPYSLGDAIDWKLSQDRSNICLRCLVPYSLGDAIDWKPHYAAMRAILYWSPLLARGRDRLETHLISLFNSMIYFGVPYSLGDAIDWKQRARRNSSRRDGSLLLARGRDRLETSLTSLEYQLLIVLSPTR